MATQSFNQMRWAIPLGLVCGVVLRTRAMQLTLLRQYQASQYTTQDVEYERQEETLEPSWGGAA